MCCVNVRFASASVRRVNEVVLFLPAESSLRHSKHEVRLLRFCTGLYRFYQDLYRIDLVCNPSPSLSRQLLQSALSVHPDAVEKTIDDIMTLKKINPDTNPQ